MTITLLRLLFAFSALLTLNTHALAQDTNFWIFLCFGQSNMEGFPGIEEQDKTNVTERFQMLACVDFPDLGRTKGNCIPCVAILASSASVPEANPCLVALAIPVRPHISSELCT